MPRSRPFKYLVTFLAFQTALCLSCSVSAEDLAVPASDESHAWLSVPQEAAGELSDITLRLDRQSQDEVETTLRAYRLTAYQTSTGKEIPNFHFSHAAALHFGVQGLLYIAPTGSAAQAANTERNLRGLLTPYWNTGAGYVRLGGVQQDASGLTIPVQNTGLYQLRAVAASGDFRLATGSPYPRLITPNAANNHRVFFFFENPSGKAVSGALYDRHGAKVRELHVDSLSPSPNALVWDGRDDQGAVVPGGAYFYKISDGDKTLTGSVGVAR